MTLTVMVVVGGDEVEDRDEDDMNFELAISNLDEGKICVGSWFLRLQSTFFFCRVWHGGSISRQI